MLKTLPSIFGDFKHLARDDREEYFSEFEWQCAVYFWRATGQRGGPVQYLFLTDSGALDGEALETLREIVDAAPSRLARPLTYDLVQSPAGSAILDVAKKAGLAWTRAYDSGVILFHGTTRLGPTEPGDPAWPRVPRLGDLAPVRSAVAKLQNLLGGSGPLRFHRSSS